MSGTDGRYELLTGVGTHDVLVTRAGSSTEERRVELSSGQKHTLDVALHPTGSLLFRVEIADRRIRGQPLVEARIEGDPTSLRTLRRYSGGAFAFNNLRLGATYIVEITAPGRTPYTGRHDVRSGKPERITVELR